MVKPTNLPTHGRRSPCGVVAIVLDFDNVISEFKLESCYYVHFQYRKLHYKAKKKKILLQDNIKMDTYVFIGYCIHIRANALGKGMNSLIFPIIG